MVMGIQVREESVAVSDWESCGPNVEMKFKKNGLWLDASKLF